MNLVHWNYRIELSDMAALRFKRKTVKKKLPDTGIALHASNLYTIDGMELNTCRNVKKMHWNQSPLQQQKFQVWR